MKAVKSVLMVAVLLSTSLMALALPSSAQPEAIPPGWYSHWFRDANTDHIDDLLMDGSSTSDIFVNYYRPVTDKDLSALDGFGQRTWVDPYIDVVLLSGVAKTDLVRISELPGVVMVEKQLPLHSMLNVSVPNLRGNASSVYSVGARNLGYNGTGVTVAIFDTGVNDDTHQSLDDLDDNAATNDPKFLAGYDATVPLFKETNPGDIDGHGTHVAGIAIGTGGPASTRTYVGVAPGANGVDVKVMNAFGAGNPQDFLDALAWCRLNMDTYHIKVLSMSLGTTGTSDGNDTLSRAVNDAVRRDGLVVVAAMGNDGPSNSGLPAPAAADESIAVGAYDDHNTIARSDDTMASFSNLGPRVSDGDNDLLDELKPDVAAPGVSIWSAMFTIPSGYTTMTGTSQATPHVSGVVALMLQANPDLTPQEIKKILRDTAQAKGTASLPTLDPKYNSASGWGFVDAYGAVKRAEDLKKGASVVGPPAIQSGSSAAITIKFKFTRTEFMSTFDNASMNITVPHLWGKPSNIAIASSEGVAYTSGHTEPIEGTTNWTLTAWANYTGTVLSPTLLEPTVTFNTFAPAQTGTYSFGMAPQLNKIQGTIKTTDIQVTPGTGGKPDLNLASSDISFSTDTPILGQIVSISAVIHNGGNLGANANVTFSDGPPQTGFIFGSSSVSVPAGGVDTAQAFWIASPGNHSIYAYVDYRNQVNESNENNNGAFKVIGVKGINNPPTAALTVDPATAGIFQNVRFDGANSTDLDGRVVLYNFNFGDGNNSGWVASNNVTHSYSQEGLFIATLTVQDNGGARSTNNPQSFINVMPTSTKTRAMFIAEAYHLTFSEPEGATQRIGLPNGWVAIPPGSPFGTTENREIGTWKSNTFTRNMTIDGVVKYHLWVNDTGIEGIDVTNFTFFLKLNDNTLDKVVNTQLTTMLPGQAVELQSTSGVNDIRIKSGDVLSLNLWCAIHGNNGVMEFGSKARPSGMDLSFTTFPGIPPVVNAGQNITARVNTTVNFEPTASDEDGTIIKWEWDFETDGTWDYSSAKTGTTTHIYTIPGTYNATLRVTDNDADTTLGIVTVIVLPPNRAPVMKNPVPISSSVTIEAEGYQIFSITVTDPDNDPLTFKWTVDNKKRVESGSSFNWTTSETDVGSHEVKITASDGTDSTSHSWSTIVQAVNHPPVIDAISPTTKFVTVSSDSFQVFQVSATDPEGSSLIFKWTLDGVVVGSQEDYQYNPDDSSVGSHTLRLEVSDGELSTFSNWTIEVTSANQAPTIRSFTPSEGDKFTTKSLIPFEVDATDANGDTLSYVWTSSIDGQLSKVKSFTLQLSNGTHKITVTVTDGRGGSASRSFNIIVTKPKTTTNPNPLGDMGTVLIVLIVVIAVIAIGGYFYMDGQRKQKELERAAALQRAVAAQKAAAAKRKKPPAKKPPTSKPRAKEDLVQKAIEEEEAEMGDAPLPKPKPVQRVTIRAHDGVKPVRKVVPRPVKKDMP
jgi:subtilisin family serine protease